MCQSPHPLRKCYKFLHLTPIERRGEAEKHGICLNCLGHKTSEPCNSSGTCKECKSNKHHTLLHINQNTVSSYAHQSASNTTPHNNQNTNQSVNVNHSNQTTQQLPISSFVSNNLTNTNSNYVLLSTALVDIRNSNGEFIRLRALGDQGAQHSIITERAHQRLKLKSIPICVGVKPMGESQYKIVNRGLNLTIHSINDPNYTVESTFAIIPSVTNDLPLFPLKTSHLQHIQDLLLADPHFDTPGPIDLLLAGDVHGKIIQIGLRKGAIDEPIAQNTSLGWIISGELTYQNHFIAQPVNCFHVSHSHAHYQKKMNGPKFFMKTRINVSLTASFQLGCHSNHISMLTLPSVHRILQRSKGLNRFNVVSLTIHISAMFIPTQSTNINN